MVNRFFDRVMCFVWLLFTYALCSMNNLIIYGLQVRWQLYFSPSFDSSSSYTGSGLSASHPTSRQPLCSQNRKWKVSAG